MSFLSWAFESGKRFLLVRKCALIPGQLLSDFPAVVDRQILHTVRELYFTTFVIDAYFRRDSNSAAISSAF
jgi:hypothetical protein